MSFITPSFSSNLITPSFLWKKSTGLSLSVLNPFLCFLLSGFPAPYLETINGSEYWQGPPVCDALPVRGCPGNPILPPVLGISWLACTMQSSCREPNDRGHQSSWAEGRCNAMVACGQTLDVHHTLRWHFTWEGISRQDKDACLGH